MDSKSDDQDFSPAEARNRFEAALKGARVAGHKPMESLKRSTVKKGRKPKKKSKASA
jgi:hypothetical protein